eukprot:Partr_v1_DN26662_c1_g1_i4_m69166 putative debranching enzyme
MSVPSKFRQLGSFHLYYAGIKKAPITTIFIGGNHESSAYMWELMHGGWAAPNIYYMGAASIVKFGDLRIGGLSGIYKSGHYFMGHHERFPLNSGDLRSIYHVRHFHVSRLLMIRSHLDIMLSHDWPLGIYHFGDTRRLLKAKPYFRAEIDENSLGSPACDKLLRQLKPSRWFSAHLHVEFEALFKHSKITNSASTGDEIRAKQAMVSTTSFHALDKCGKNRKSLVFVDIEDADKKAVKLSYDPEWLAIVRACDKYQSYERRSVPIPADLDLRASREWIDENVKEFTIPENFVKTAPAHLDVVEDASLKTQRVPFENPQIEAFCNLIGIDLPKSVAKTSSPVRLPPPPADLLKEENKEEILIDDDEFL